MNNFDLRKYLAEGGIKARLNENLDPDRENLISKIKKLRDYGFTGKGIDYGPLLITVFTQGGEREYFVYGENDESEDGIFNSTNPEEVANFVLNYGAKLNENLDPDPELYPDGYDFGGIDEGEDQDVEKVAKLFLEEGEDDYMEEAMVDDEVNESFLDEMARTSNTFSLAKEASVADVRSFMNRVNNLLKTYKSPGQKKPKSRFTPEDMDRLTNVLKKADFTSKEVLDAIGGWNNSAQANTFLKVLQDKGYIAITSELKKFSKPERDPNAPETRGRKKKVRDDDGEDNKKGDKEPTDTQIRKAAKKAGLDENDRFLNEFLKKKL
jgi:hypothetical protein